MSCFLPQHAGSPAIGAAGAEHFGDTRRAGASAACRCRPGWVRAGCRALPWAPDLSWLQLPLPSLRLSASAMATISAFAQLRADVMAQFGLDLMIAAQAQAFARLTATASARLSAMLGAGIGGLGLGWQQLAALNFAIGQLQAALSLGLFANLSAYGAWPDWRAFLAALRALLPLIAVSLQMNLALNASMAVQLSAAIRAHAGDPVAGHSGGEPFADGAAGRLRCRRWRRCRRASGFRRCNLVSRGCRRCCRHSWHCCCRRFPPRSGLMFRCRTCWRCCPPCPTARQWR
ncbi:MAG: hypothetical protein WDN04_09980 [Rhodospirillales bacterium]